MRSLAKGTGLSFAGEAGHVILTYVYGIVIARFLGGSDYGIFFLGITIFNLVCLFALGGVEDALLRFIGLYAGSGRENQSKAVIRLSFLIAIGAGFGLGLLCFLLKDVMANRIFHKPELAVVMGYLSPAIPVFALMAVSVASIRGYKVVFPYVFVRKIFFPLIGLVLAVAVMLTGGGLRGVSGTYLLSVLIAAGLGYHFLIRYLSPFTGDVAPVAGRREYFSFLGVAYLSNILIFLFTWCDLIVLGVMSPSEKLGIYFAAKKTALALGILLVSLNVILGPMISHLYSGQQHAQLDRAFKTGTQWIVALGLPILLIILFFSREIMSIFGPAFTGGQLSLIILACGQFVNISVGSVGYLLLMTGNQKWMVINAIGAVCLNIPLMILLVSRYGITGAAWATGITMTLANLVTLIEVYVLLGLHPYSVRYFKLLLLAALTAGVVGTVRFYLIDSTSVVYIMGQIGFIFIFFFTLLVFFGLTANEKKKLLLIRKKPLPVLVREILAGDNDR